MSGNITAPEGQLFICSACGKRSRDKYGFQTIDRGWDESCMLHAILCFDKKNEHDRWVAVPAKD